MIFYYSATGISKRLATIIADRIQDTLIDIESVLDDAPEYTLKSDERLGFVVPVYFGDIPDVVTRFIQKLKINTADNYYCFIALTYGGDCFAAPNIFLHQLLRKGLTTNAVFGLRGMDTFIPFYTIPTGEERTQLDEKNALESAVIAEQIADKTEGTYCKRGPFPAVTSFFCRFLYKYMRKTANFVVSDKCTGCGLCAQNCPEKAIQIDETSKHPAWIKQNCMICFRCLHHCPAEAIDYGSRSINKPRLKDL